MAERTVKLYNMHLIDPVVTPTGFPYVFADDPAGITRAVGFNYARSKGGDMGSLCHFFIDDYQFERVWNRPEESIELLYGFGAVCTPDFSLYMDMPEPVQRWNKYRSMFLGQWWQSRGLTVIPTLQWAGPESYDWCFDGIEGGTVSVSAVGCCNSRERARLWQEGMDAAIRAVEPTRIIEVGACPDYEFGGERIRLMSNWEQRYGRKR